MFWSFTDFCCISDGSYRILNIIGILILVWIYAKKRKKKKTNYNLPINSSSCFGDHFTNIGLSINLMLWNKRAKKEVFYYYKITDKWDIFFFLWHIYFYMHMYTNTFNFCSSIWSYMQRLAINNFAAWMWYCCI